MSKKEINGLFFWRESCWMPCGLNLKEKLWWRFMPGVIINVRWPSGKITVDDLDPRWDWTLGSTLQESFSADPNDHYRPWLEKNVGRQGWDWNWGVAGMDAAENRLTIKIRQKFQDRAIIAALKWS